jgi:6-phosphogluconolactonase
MSEVYEPVNILDLTSLMKTASILCAMILTFGSVIAQQTKSSMYHLLIGTYANQDKSNGIHVYRFNTEDGSFEEAGQPTPLLNSSYLAISDDKKNVYAVGEGGQGSVNAYSFDPITGKLAFLNSVPSDGPCYVSVDKQKKFVFAGNYGGGSVVSVPVKADGSFRSNEVQKIQHEGKSVITDRQEKPHVHAVVLSPDHRYLLVPDLGVDKIYQYKIDVSKKEALMPAAVPFTTVKPGGGPRHLAFHPNGKYAYLALELVGDVAVFDYKDGKLDLKQTVTMIEPGFKGQISAADIHTSPDGKFLYASNRGDADQIAIYAIGKDGKLTIVGHQSVMGKTPRNFAIDPSGNFLLAANQNTNDVIIFKRDLKTGLLTPTGSKISVDKPVCLKFVEVGN